MDEKAAKLADKVATELHNLIELFKPLPTTGKKGAMLRKAKRILREYLTERLQDW